ncbi:hypothetical protein Sjap_024391 [Stephania japonica]|uniref:AAA+ ATPase domain-containing protein n=1 Tax=Stephania japonica TaxID=461633 RepID=A0AAP0HLF9_9MAGN
MEEKERERERRLGDDYRLPPRTSELSKKERERERRLGRRLSSPSSDVRALENSAEIVNVLTHRFVKSIVFPIESLAIGPCVELVKCTGGPISRRIDQLRKLSSNLKILKVKRGELAAKESDTKTQIELAQERGKLPLQEVLHWLKNVEGVKSEVRDIEESFETHKARCFFSNCASRLKLAKQVVDKIREVEELRARQFSDGLVTDQREPKEIMLNPPTIFGDSTTDRIMKLLMEPKIWKVGVYGMGGVGKTTIMKAVHDKLLAKETFDNVIWVTATKDNLGGIEGLQKKIAQRLGDDFFTKISSNEDKVIRASMLSHKLQQVGKFVLIIDDLWEKIRLDEVGIPEPNEENKESKVVVISRQVPVCNSMETQENVEVKCLSEEAAWELFVSKTGEEVHMSDIKPLAKRVSKECAGLPLAIITVGCSMRRKHSTNEWSNAVNELKNSRGDDLDMDDKVFKILRFSYDSLKEKAKSCFLYCAFYPEDYQIDTALLIEHWMAEGYTSKGRPTSEYCGTWDREKEINKGFHILEELKDSCLLENVKVFARRDNVYVKMHDLVRDLAIQIMRELNFISKAGLELRRWPQEEFGKACKISLVDVYLETFPDQPSCPNLSTLFLGKANLVMQEWKMSIPRMFFSQMPALQVLDISFLEVVELPESLSELANLRALFLENLKVKKIPSLGKLMGLMLLSMRDSWIEETPEGMEALVNLRFLNLDGTRGLRNFDADLISKLTLLEELRMRSSVVLAKSSRIAAKCIQVIANLKHLTNLSISFQEFDNYLKAVECIQWNKLKSFHLGMSLTLFYDAYKIFPSGNYSRKLVSIAFFDGNWSSFQFPRDTEVLWFNGCVIPNLSGSQCLKNLGYVKEVYLIQCNFSERPRIKDHVHTLFRDDNSPELLASSEICTLDWYFRLEVFSRGSLSKGCLENLKYLIVSDCQLKNLLTVNTLQELKNLEFMRIAYCK